jgi:hypothetical protein
MGVDLYDGYGFEWCFDFSLELVVTMAVLAHFDSFMPVW